MTAIGFLLKRFASAAPGPLLLGTILLVLTLAAGLGLLAVSGWLIAGAGLAGLGLIVFDTFAPSAGVRFFALARTGLRYGERLVSHGATFRILARLRVEVFRGLARQARLRLRSADLLARLSSDLDALDGLHLRFAAPVVAALVLMALAALALAAIDPVLAVAVTAPVVLFGIVIPFGLGLSAARDARLRHVGLDAVRVRLVDLDRGRTELAIAGRLDEAVGAVGRAADWIAGVERRLHARDAGLRFAAGLAGPLAIAAALVVGSDLAAAGDLSAVGLVLVVLAAFAFGETVTPLRSAALELGRLVLAARRIASLVRTGSTPATDLEPRRPAAPAGIVFRSVSFTWGDGRPAALSAIDAEVAPGERVALVGESGSGKSTLLALAAGLQQAARGSVTVGGEPILRPGLSASGHRIGLLSQRPELFRETVADAVRLGAPDAGDREVAGWLQAAGLPIDPAKALGDGGSGLSGGERRRLAMARLLASGPDVVLLDEPTEGLDHATAAGILEGLRTAIDGRTVLIATHLADEAALADRLIRIRSGRLVAEARRGTSEYEAMITGLVHRDA